MRLTRYTELDRFAYAFGSLIATTHLFSKPGIGAPDAESILALCREQLAAFKVPRAIQFVADLPKTSTGKIMRRELRTLDA